MTAMYVAALTRKSGSSPIVAMVMPATAGPMMRVRLNTALFRATALATSDLPTISTTNDWRMGMSKALTMPRIDRQREDLPHLDPAAGDEEAERQRQPTGDCLGDDERATLVDRVGHDPAEEAENEDRRPLRGRDEAQRDRVAGQLQDQPALAHDLHPVADQRDQHAEPEESEVVVPESPQPVGQAGRLRRRSEVRVGWLGSAGIGNLWVGHSAVSDVLLNPRTRPSIRSTVRATPTRPVSTARS